MSASASASGAANGTRTLDSSPPMPSSQRRPPSVLFTPPMDEDSGMGAMGGDPMIQTMAAQKAVDMAMQKLSILYPQAVEPLASLQMQFRQLTMMLLQSAADPTGGMGGGMGMGGEMGAPGMGAGMIPPAPMAAGMGPSAGQQQGPSM